MIQLRHVSQKFRTKTTVLADISISIDKGEFVFLVGPSGAGKTTILRLLFRDISPQKGEVIVDGTNVTKLTSKKIPFLRRKIGIVFQDFKILYDQTIFENVALTLEILGKSKKEITKKVAEILDVVGLKGKNGYFPVQLSAGELQRVAIARAIIGGPKVLLADEPTGNLDPKTSREIVHILQEINKLGTTVIMATHDSEIVNQLKKRVVTIKSGKITKDQKNSSYE